MGTTRYPASASRWNWARSGHVQYVKSLALDCDGDAILVQVDQVGAACHTGKRSCFEEGGPLPVVVGDRTAEQENA